MKFFRYLLFSAVFAFGAVSCKKETKNIWNVEIKESAKNVAVTDISKEFYDTNVPLEEFKQKYPWFQGSVPDEDYSIRRADTAEVKIYKEAISKIDIAKLNKDLTGLFSHIKYHFPEFTEPQVFLFSSALSGIMEPVFYRNDVNMLFIDVTGFMGDNNPNYKGLEQYFQLSMNPQNIVPKVSQTFAEYFVQPNLTDQKFIDELIYQGKIMTLQDAFLPDFPDYLKMHYSQKQYEWAKENEVNIWNYFVESNLIFSDDIRLKERFINPGPFSKFYTEIDNESSPRVGVFTGWQISRKFYQEKPETKLADFLNMNAQDIFNQSNYKPKY
ncbi:MAG: gliding motility protein GldB [Flavobacteriia bacterium]|nr:gliding motility protein GldB [Flavobacteriia bacterium]MBH2022858.1 gliding motility protein GldB [Flavobacteriales bacterium]